MTLITYLTRVHFADGVLEEALRSELEHNRRRRPLIIADRPFVTGPLADRIFASFPIRTHAETFIDVPPAPTEQAALRIANRFRETDRDHLIAFGGNRAIDLAKVARIAIAYDEPLAALSSMEGGAQRIGDDLPDLYAVPGVSGFSSSVSHYARVRLNDGRQVLIATRHLIPTVTICDPTLTRESPAAISASAASGAISRGVEVFLSRGYNPPADGLALDGLARTARYLDRVIGNDDPEARREMMAGSLNSALSLQKGVCAVHAISNALASVTHSGVDPNAVGRLIVPNLVRFYGASVKDKLPSLRRAFALDSGGDVADGIDALLADLPLPNRLSDMGIGDTDIANAALMASLDRAVTNSPRRLGVGDIEYILRAAL